MNKKILVLLFVAILIAAVFASHYDEDLYDEDFDEEEETETLFVNRDCRSGNKPYPQEPLKKSTGLRFKECKESATNNEPCRWCWNINTQKATQAYDNGYCEYGNVICADGFNPA